MRQSILPRTRPTAAASANGRQRTGQPGAAAVMLAARTSALLTVRFTKTISAAPAPAKYTAVARAAPPVPKNRNRAPRTASPKLSAMARSRPTPSV